MLTWLGYAAFLVHDDDDKVMNTLTIDKKQKVSFGYGNVLLKVKNDMFRLKELMLLFHFNFVL